MARSQDELEARIDYLERAVKALLEPVAMGVWKAQVVEGDGGDQGGGQGVDLSPGTGDSGATPGTNSTTTDPANQYPGMFWFRSDTLQLAINVGGTVRRSGVFT